MIFQPTLSSGPFSNPGADVTRAFGAPGTGSGLPASIGRYGTTVTGDNMTEFVLAKLTLAAPTDMLFGMAFQLDKDFNASLLTTANWVANADVVFGQFFQPALAAGTYGVWLARAGHIGVQMTTAAAGGLLETTATAGKLNAPAAVTTGSRAVLPGVAPVASVAFTATTTTGSPTLAGISSVADLSIGMSIAGAGIPANAVIQGFRRGGGGYLIDMVSSAALTTPLAATASAAGVTVTGTGVLPAIVMRPTMSKTN